MIKYLLNYFNNLNLDNKVENSTYDYFKKPQAYKNINSNALINGNIYTKTTKE
tara:strand:+ start:38 stop:196 length:159 start_codon:yes stop_codon:yes gene_type:complete